MFQYNEQNISLIKSDSIVMEGLRQIAMDLPASERLHYTDIACETMMTNEDRATLVNKLYKSVSAKANEIDFGKIPDSKGDVTKYYYYQQLVDTLEILGKLEDVQQVESIVIAQKLHYLLLNNIEAFTYGYKRDIEILKNTYSIMVMMLYSMVDMGISDYTKELASSITTGYKHKGDIRDSMILHSARDLVKYFEIGKFNMLYQAIRKGAATQTAAAVDAASESVAADTVLAGAFSLGVLPGVLSGSSFLGFLIALLGLLLILRPVVYFLSKGISTLSQWARRQANFIKVAMTIESSGDPDVANRRKKMVDKLTGLADVIDYQILKCEHAAVTDLIKDNKAELNTKEISITDNSQFSF